MEDLGIDVIPTPEQFLGFEVGEDRKLADWPQIVEYFRMLGERSDRVLTREIGKSTEGNPFLVAVITSPGDLARLEHFREIQQRLADPRKLQNEAEALRLADDGKAVVLVTCSIHATEVGATQMSLMLAHHLATSDDAQVRRILDNVILLLVPSLNPDGLIKVKNWYDSTLGTSYEGAFPPFLYHRYTGHDNNRDWFMFTQAETRLVVEHCLNAWRPQVTFDLHQTRATGMRMILPPFIDPIGPNVDPVVQSQLTMIGTAIASELTAQGKPGVAVNVVYDAYSPSRSYAHYHGGIRILSEAAGVRIASPVHVDKSQLRPARGEEPLSSSWNHPLPWPGGRWTLRDIVEYDFAAVMACLKHVANDKTSWLRNFYQIGNRAVTSSHNPFAYLIPEQQRDPVTADELCGILRRADVEIHEASQAFSADGNPHPTGTKVVFCRQPYGSFAKTMLEIQRYPDMRQFPGGPPIVPYDVTAHSLPLQMGVDVVEVKSAFHVPTRPAAPACSTKGMVSARSECPRVLLVRPETNISAAAVNMLLAKGVRVSRASEPVQTDNGYYPAGTFIVEAGEDALTLAEQIAARCSLRVDVIRDVPKVSAYTLCRPRIGVYQSYVASADEGWTRFVLEQYGFEYETILDEDVRAGGLQKRFDCVLLPHQTLRHLHQGHDAAYYAPQYAGGLGDEGAESLRAFVESGGTLIAWDGSSRYAIQHLDLPVSNVLAGLPSSSFFAPGSLLRVLLDTTHPVAYGMPDPAAVMFVNSPAFEVREGRVIGRYPLHNPLRSGLLIGADKLFGKCAVASIPVGQGRVVLIGFRVHFRAQARGTYKLLFNSIFLSAALE